MKKLIGVSLIAMLAVGPLAANATPDYASAIPAEPVTVTANTNVASTSYVQGAYNAAVAVANKENQRALAAEGDLTTLTTTAKGSLVAAINEINTTAGGAVQSVAEGATNGTISVDGTDVAVHGLGSAAYTASTDYISSAAGSVKTANIDDGQVTKAKLAQTVQDSLDAADSALQAADITEGSANGTIKVDGTDVAVHGLGSAAYVNTGDLADTAGTYDNTGSGLTATTIQDAIDEVAAGAAAGATALQAEDIAEGATNGTISVDGTDVAVHGLGSAAYTASTDYATAAQGTKADNAETLLGNTAMGTTATTVTAAIKELKDASDEQSAKVLKVYTTWNTNTNQEVTLTDPTVVQP